MAKVVNFDTIFTPLMSKGGEIAQKGVNSLKLHFLGQIAGAFIVLLLSHFS